MRRGTNRRRSGPKRLAGAREGFAGIAARVRSSAGAVSAACSQTAEGLARVGKPRRRSDVRRKDARVTGTRRAQPARTRNVRIRTTSAGRTKPGSRRAAPKRATPRRAMPRRGAPARTTSRGETSPKRAWTFRHVAVVVSAVILGIGMGYAISRASQWGQSAEQFLLSQIEVIGNEVLTEGEVVGLSGLTTGTNLLSISIASVERAVAASPRVERARVLRLLPDRIVVRIEERTPVALLATAAFGCVEVTDDGLVLPPVERTALADLPLIVGAADSVELGGVAASGDVEYVLELLRTARAIEPALWMEISEIRIAPGSGLVIYTAADGAEIRVGTGALDSRDLKRLWMVLTDLKSRGDVVESIDFRYKDQAVVRLRAAGGRGRV